MTFQPAPDCAEAVIKATYGGKEINNVLNFYRTGGYVQLDLDNLAAVVDLAVHTYYKPYISNQATYIGTTVRGLATAIDLQSVNADHAGVCGAGGVALPANTSLCATLRTGFTGRSARGRFYAMPSSVTFLAGVNTFDPVYGNAIGFLLDHIRSEALLQGWSMIVLSRRHDGVVRPSAVGYPVYSIQVRNFKADSMRNRLPDPH